MPLHTPSSQISLVLTPMTAFNVLDPRLRGQVKLVHMEAERTAARTLRFHHKISMGASDLESGYGIAVSTLLC